MNRGFGRRTRKQQIATLSIIAVAVITLSIGFAAFSSTLRISSQAQVNPDATSFSVIFSKDGTNTDTTQTVNPSSSTYGEAATITNGVSPTLTGIKAKFTAPGQSVNYSFYAKNTGSYLAYLNSITFENVEGESKNIVCTAQNGTSQDLVDQACEGISINIKVGAEEAVTTSQSGILGHTLTAGNSESIIVTVNYASNATVADGDFTVAFGDISLIYSTVEDATGTTPGGSGSGVGGGTLASGWQQDGTTIYGKASDGTPITLNVGDQIAYDAYTGVDSSLLTYTATTTMTGNSTEEAMNGYVGDGQNKTYAVTQSDVNRVWKVMGVSDGKLLITTEVLTPKLILTGYTGLVNGSSILNNIGSIYGHGKGAEKGRSISVTDINYITGSSCTTITPEETKEIFESEGEAWYGTRCEYSLTDSAYVNLLSGNYWTNTQYDYMPGVIWEGDDMYTGPQEGFSGLVCVNENKVSSNYDLYGNLSVEYGYENSVKPVVELKSDVSLEKDNSTGVWNIK